MNEIQVKELLIRYEKGECTEAEAALVETFYLEYKEEEAPILTANQIERSLKNVSAVLPINKPVILWPKYAAAASLLIGLTAGIYLFSKRQPTRVIAQDQVIQPGSNKAILVLANGQRVSITDATKGTIAQQGSATISKSANGQLVYQKTTNSAEVSYNMLITPKGGQNYIKLIDGTEVWLNAASSIRFPTAFSGKDRVVEITGEADFLVAHDQKQPFYVIAGGQRTRDIGTEFDINAYTDEPAIKTTLVEGAVEVSTNSGIVKRLKPGQQSLLAANELKIGPGDIKEALAWKKGRFIYNDESLESIMRKAARWYDVDVVYAGVDAKKKYWGNSSRYNNISELLGQLELTGGIHFKIEGRRVIVTR